MTEPSSVDARPAPRLDELAAVLYREAHCLDTHDWDGWLALYCDDGQFWMPAWTGEHTVADTAEPTQSLILCPSRAAMLERVTYLRSGLSSAWYPLQRTCHSVTTVIAPRLDADQAELHASFVCHVWNLKRREQFALFGRYEHRLRRQGNHWLIARKKIVLMNERLPTMIDFYCV